MFSRAIPITFLIFAALLPAVAQKSKTLSTKEISRLLPDRIKGYSPKGDAKATKVKLGTLTYSLSEKSFTKGARSFKMLLFDYAEAPVMFDQAMRKWREIGTVESDSLIFRPMDPTDSSSWESYSAAARHSQIIMGINNRFFFTLDGEKMELYELKLILLNFDFSKFPKN
jgi:hypothetical protein